MRNARKTSRGSLRAGLAAAVMGSALLVTPQVNARGEIWIGFHPTTYTCKEGSPCILTITKFGRGPATVKVSTDDQSHWQPGAMFLSDNTPVSDMWCEEGAASDDPCRHTATSAPSNNAASFGLDYSLSLHDLVFGEDETQKTIPVTITSDGRIEGQEIFYVNLTVDILHAPGSRLTDDDAIQPRLRQPGNSALVFIRD